MLCHSDRAYSMHNICWVLTVVKVPGICKPCYKINVEQVEASEVCGEEEKITDRKVAGLKVWVVTL